MTRLRDGERLVKTFLGASSSPMTTDTLPRHACPLYTIRLESLSPAPILQASTEIVIPIHNKEFTGLSNYYRNMFKI